MKENKTEQSIGGPRAARPPLRVTKATACHEVKPEPLQEVPPGILEHSHPTRKDTGQDRLKSSRREMSSHGTAFD